MSDGTKIEWTDATCETCGVGFDRRRGSTRFCSRACYAARPGIKSDLERDAQRVSWTQRTWYGPDRDMLNSIDGKRTGDATEATAETLVLSRLGFDSVINLARLSHGSPVDFICRHRGERVLVEVTRKWQKRVVGKTAFAAALGFPLFVVFVNPRDPKYSVFLRAPPEAKSVRVPINWVRYIASDRGEAHHV